MFLLHQLFGNDTPDNKSIFENNNPEYPVHFAIAQTDPVDSTFEVLFRQNKALYEMLSALIELQAERHSPMDYDFSHYKPLFATKEK